MNKLIIKDNSINTISRFDSIKNIKSVLVDKTLNQLEKEGVFVFPNVVRDSQDLENNQIVLQKCDDVIKTGNVMGFIGTKDEKLIISSRFSNDKDYLFQYLLSKVFNIPNIINFDSESDPSSNYIDLLLYMFPYFLAKAMKKGLYKTYVKEQRNDFNIKGTIDIARHIKENLPFRGTVAYNKKEQSYDNYVIELVRHTIEFIKLKPNGNTILNSVKNETHTIIENTNKYNVFDRRKVINYNQKHLIHHAYYYEYILLQRICLYILTNQKHQTGTGNLHINGILFDGSWLWEEYVNTVLQNYFYHPRNKSSEGKQHLFANKTQIIYPDFIGKTISNSIIADAKYKPINNIARDDYFQLLSYMFRFDAKTGLFIYPETDECEYKELYLNQGDSYHNNIEKRDDIKIVKCSLTIPNCDNYYSFANNMKTNETKMREKIENFINN